MKRPGSEVRPWWENTELRPQRKGYGGRGGEGLLWGSYGQIVAEGLRLDPLPPRMNNAEVGPSQITVVRPPQQKATEFRAPLGRAEMRCDPAGTDLGCAVLQRTQVRRDQKAQGIQGPGSLSWGCRLPWLCRPCELPLLRPLL